MILTFIFNSDINFYNIFIKDIVKMKQKKEKEKTMKKIRKNRGITLVALVITIVLNCSCLATERNKRIAKI